MRQKEKTIGRIIYRWLIVLVLLAFVIAALVGYFVQNYFQERQSFTLLREYIEDVVSDWDFNGEIKEYITQGWGMDSDTEEGSFHDYQDNGFLQRLIEPNAEWISEVSIVDGRGIITYSSDPEKVGYDLHDSDYMSEFLCILGGEDYYAGDFYPDPFEADPDLKMVYAGVSVKNYDGLVLFGFNRQAWANQLGAELWDSIYENRIGETGYLIACNKDKIIEGVTAVAINETLDENNPVTEEVELPETEDEITETITDFYGQKCYVSAVKRPDYYLIAAYPVKEAHALREKYNVIFVIVLFVVLAALFIVLYFLLKNHVVREIGSIHGSLKKITEGDLDEKADTDGSLEFYELSVGINSTVSNLKDRIQEAKEQMAAEMEKAGKIQEAAVPGDFPEHDAFGLFASMRAAESVGGDFYDFFLTDANTLAFVVADVSEKGMPAALYMMRAKTLIKTFAEQGLSVDEVAQQVNHTLCEDNPGNMFVTAWLGFLDLRTGLLSYVHAGHTMPVHIGDEISFVKKKFNLVLGAMKEASYTRQEIRLLPGESIYLYTDGVTEANNAAEEMYDEERLIALIRENQDKLAGLEGNALCKAGCEMVYQSVMGFAGDAPQFDDITMLWVTYKGGKA